MADFDICTNTTCPSNDRCHTAMATPDPYYQSYCRMENIGDKCYRFRDIKPSNIIGDIIAKSKSNNVK